MYIYILTHLYLGFLANCHFLFIHLFYFDCLSSKMKYRRKRRKTIKDNNEVLSQPVSSLFVFLKLSFQQQKRIYI